MSEEALRTTDADAPRLTADQVVAFLRQNPNFLRDNPSLLEDLLPPERQQGDRIVDMQMFMVERLRRELARLRAEQDDLVTNSRDNLSTQDRIHRAVLSFLTAESFEHLIDIITTELAMLLGVDLISLCVESNGESAVQTLVHGVHIVPPGSVDQWIGAGRSHILRDDVQGDPVIFGPGAGLVRSDALMRLHISRNAPPGLIAFGTRHPGYFDPAQGTDLLNFMVKVLEHCVRAWLDIDPS